MANPNPKTDHLVATQFKKGHARPPGAGRKKRDPQTAANANMLETKAPREFVKALKKFGVKKGATFADINAAMLERLALDGKPHSIAAIKELRESVGGKAAQRIELYAREDRQIRLEVSFDGDVPAMPEASKPIDVTPKLVEETAPAKPEQ